MSDDFTGNVNLYDREQVAQIAEQWWNLTPVPDVWIKKMNEYCDGTASDRKREYYKLMEANKMGRYKDVKKIDPKAFTFTKYAMMMETVLSLYLVPRSLHVKFKLVNSCATCKYCISEGCLLRKPGTWLPTFPFKKEMSCHIFGWDKCSSVIDEMFKEGEDYNFVKKEMSNENTSSM